MLSEINFKVTLEIVISQPRAMKPKKIANFAFKKNNKFKHILYIYSYTHLVHKYKI